MLFTALFLIFREPVMHYFAKESPLLSEYYLLLIPLGLATLFYNFYSAWLQALSRTIISSAVNEVLLRLLITAEISLYALGCSTSNSSSSVASRSTSSRCSSCCSTRSTCANPTCIR
ncbi:MAG: hypothetical protein ACLR8Y_00060 [Alistipes indistinctus]